MSTLLPSTAPAGPPRARPGWTRLVLLSLLVAMVVVLLLRTFVVEVFAITSASMGSTVQVGDRVLVDKLTPGGRQVAPGAVVVFDGEEVFGSGAQHGPTGVGALRRLAGWFGAGLPGERDYVKRVIGLPGDEVRCCTATGQLVVNGVALDEPYLFPGDEASTVSFDVRVPPDRVWVMGDHRSASQDSRAHLGDPGGGMVPMADIIGTVRAVVWPVARWSRVPALAGGRG